VFEKILVPLDGSEHSQRALECAVQISKRFNSKVTLLHVYSVAVPPVVMPEPSTLTPAGVPVPVSTEVQKMVEGLRDAGKNILSDAEQWAKSAEVETETLLKEGNAAQEIVRTAREGEYNLIVIGARGMSRIKELFMGNVSEGVIKNAPCPVLIVK
jgi:nucleotide-binding universal stress UspA family protein